MQTLSAFVHKSRVCIIRRLYSHHSIAYSPRRGLSCAHLSPLADAFNCCISPNSRVSSREPTGLFGNVLLSRPEGFAEIASDASRRCSQLLHEAVSENRSRKMVQVLDDMSNTLCRVADLADCVRMLHPEEAYRLAAANACQTIGNLVEELNTSTDLYISSVRASQNVRGLGPPLPADVEMDRVDKRVLDLFVADFELSGVQLQDAQRRADFVKAASVALALGSEFVEVSHSPVLFDPNQMEIDSRMKLFEPIELYHPVMDDPRPEVRAATYLAYYAPLTGQEERLTQLMAIRQRMAEAAGFKTFADRATLHSLAETPERVNAFLDNVCALLSPMARMVAHEQLMPLVQSSSRFSSLTSNSRQSGSRLSPWDLSFALGQRRHAMHLEELTDYFSLGACMEGVSQLADCLFGLKLKVEPTRPGETWHPSVLKVGVYSTQRSSFGVDSSPEKPVGLVYCDLLDRPGKPAQDCHYTIQGGRCLNGNHTPGVTPTDYQIPIITLQLTLTPPSDSSRPPLLSLGQVDNLFHEWGHAIHSMLARTRYQHVTGTRCSTDLAELPSTLFENFALDPRVTKQFARHWSTGSPPGKTELKALQRLAVGRHLGRSIELLQQASYACLDQILHAGPPETTLLRHSPIKNTDSPHMPPSAHLLAHIQHRAGMSDWLACEAEYLGAWPHRFTHLVGYGGRYYAYLMAKAGAELVWRQCFARDPWSSSQGQLYSERLLQHGGEFHPASMLSDLLSASDPESDVQDTEDPSLLSPVKLARGLADQVGESEEAASSLINHLQAPGLYQPRTVH
ncbi:unnamed protein product [Calicophoron daubneyi]|uniref:Peptidase M3A/M3B catalytic domain-containing protein n=1 Tax=Calicophoron daubneyi TaxID=300641 RepID=A0AAV2TTY5_CALDB